MKKKAFTLIEILVVITIIAIMTGFFILTFAGANERQEIQLFTDEAQAALQTARTDVSAGKKEESVICSGLYFEKGELPKKATFPYMDDACDWRAEVLGKFATEPNDMAVSSIKVANSEESSIYVLFVPPAGEMKIFSGGSELSGAALLEIQKGNRKIVFDLDPLSNKISLTIVNEE